MKQYQINRAYGALRKLMSMELPIRESYKVTMLAKQLEFNYNFELDREKKMLLKYHGKRDSNGEIIFQSEEDAAGFKKESIELSMMDVDITIEPIELSFDSFGEQYLTPNDILCLDGFVKFV